MRMDLCELTYRLATLALSSWWELPDMSLISLAIWSSIVADETEDVRQRGQRFFYQRGEAD